MYWSIKEIVLQDSDFRSRILRKLVLEVYGQHHGQIQEPKVRKLEVPKNIEEILLQTRGRETELCATFTYKNPYSIFPVCTGL